MFGRDQHFAAVRELDTDELLGCLVPTHAVHGGLLDGVRFQVNGVDTHVVDRENLAVDAVLDGTGVAGHLLVDELTNLDSATVSEQNFRIRVVGLLF